MEVQFGRYQKNILQEWSMVKNISCVSCAAWNVFPINSLVSHVTVFPCTDVSHALVFQMHLLQSLHPLTFYMVCCFKYTAISYEPVFHMLWHFIFTGNSHVLHPLRFHMQLHFTCTGILHMLVFHMCRCLTCTSISWTPPCYMCWKGRCNKL